MNLSWMDKPREKRFNSYSKYFVMAITKWEEREPEIQTF